jgi:hypothetical protein
VGACCAGVDCAYGHQEEEQEEQGEAREKGCGKETVRRYTQGCEEAKQEEVASEEKIDLEEGNEKDHRPDTSSTAESEGR